MATAKFIGVHLAWQYEGKCSVTMSMPGYVDKSPERFKVTTRGPRVNNPMRFTPPKDTAGTPQVPLDEARRLLAQLQT
jgi:hypothetical protein